MIKYSVRVLVMLIPALAGMFLMHQTQGESLFRSYPVWTDEVWYWHQAQSFAEAGLNSGYYTIKEVPAQAQFSPFNPWGISVPLFYGTIAAVFGWSLHSIMLINLIALTAAIALFVWVMKPSLLQAIMCVLVFALYPPLILYSYSSLLTVMQMAIGIALTAGFLVVLRNRESTPRSVWLALIIGIGVATFIRVTWAFCYVPLVLLVSERITWRRWITALSVAGVAFLVGTVILSVTGAPYPNVMNEVFASAENGIGAMLAVILANAQSNLASLDSGQPFEVLQRQQVALFTVLVLISAGWFWWHHRRHSQTYADNRFHAIGLILFLMGVLSVLTVLLYDVKLARDFRLFAPILLMGLLLSIAYRWWGVILPLLISLMIALPGTLQVYEIWSQWHVDPAGHNAYHAWHAEISKHIQYESDAPNRWCNTLLHSHSYVWSQTYILLSTPAGIGLTTTFEQQDMPPPYQSRWLMFTDDEIQQYADSDALDVVPLLDVPGGKFYYNQESACPVLQYSH